MKRIHGAMLAALALLLPAVSHAQWTIASPDGKSSLKLGFLAQAQLEETKPVGGDTYQQNLFLRRFRVIGTGKTSERTSFFFETDVPNLGKGTTTGAKTDNTMFLQDVHLSQRMCSHFQVDVGMLLVPLSHNSTQSAASLLAVDYGAYSFLNSTPTDSKVGRDYGVQGRAYLADHRLELRGLVLQGNRGADQRGPFRVVSRAVFYPLDRDSGMFYPGTMMGKKKLVAIGASIDQQRDYQTLGGDVFVDMPVAGGDGLTLQADLMQYDGATTFPSLPKQNCVLIEAGWYLHKLKVSPFVQYASRDYDSVTLHDETRLQGGLAWWLDGLKSNLKVGVARLTRDGSDDGTQFLAQWQVLAL